MAVLAEADLWLDEDVPLRPREMLRALRFLASAPAAAAPPLSAADRPRETLRPDRVVDGFLLLVAVRPREALRARVGVAARPERPREVDRFLVVFLGAFWVLLFLFLLWLWSSMAKTTAPAAAAVTPTAVAAPIPVGAAAASSLLWRLWLVLVGVVDSTPRDFRRDDGVVDRLGVDDRTSLDGEVRPDRRGEVVVVLSGGRPVRLTYSSSCSTSWASCCGCEWSWTSKTGLLLAVVSSG